MLKSVLDDDIDNNFYDLDNEEIHNEFNKGVEIVSKLKEVINNPDINIYLCRLDPDNRNVVINNHYEDDYYSDEDDEDDDQYEDNYISLVKFTNAFIPIWDHNNFIIPYYTENQELLKLCSDNNISHVLSATGNENVVVKGETVHRVLVTRHCDSNDPIIKDNRIIASNNDNCSNKDNFTEEGMKIIDSVIKLYDDTDYYLPDWYLFEFDQNDMNKINSTNYSHLYTEDNRTNTVSAFEYQIPFNTYPDCRATDIFDLMSFSCVVKDDVKYEPLLRNFMKEYNIDEIIAMNGD